MVRKRGSGGGAGGRATTIHGGSCSHGRGSQERRTHGHADGGSLISQGEGVG